MKLINSSFSEMAQYIKASNSRVIMFGAGVIGQITVPEILRQYGLIDSIDLFIDNDSRKWQTKICLYGREIDVAGPASLETAENSVVLVNISRFSSVLDQLNSMDSLKDTHVYLVPAMCIEDFCQASSSGRTVLTEKAVIPKKIHYIWLGKKDIPDRLKKCIDSWKKYCPDYEIIRWDEDNYDFSGNRYMKETYSAGAYGFVPDYARLDILYRYGGIYLDTDVEVVRSLDPLLNQEAFCGVEKWQTINFGGCSGAAKGNRVIKRFLDAREDLSFINDDGSENRNTCGFYDSRVAIDLGYRIDGTTQCIDGMNIYGYDYFHPYDYMSGKLNRTENTYTIHWFNGGWLSEEQKAANLKAKAYFDESE